MLSGEILAYVQTKTVHMHWWQKGEDEDDIQQTGPGDPSGENVQVRESGLMTDFLFGPVSGYVGVL